MLFQVLLVFGIRFHEVSGNDFQEEKHQKSEPLAKGSDFDWFLV